MKRPLRVLGVDPGNSGALALICGKKLTIVDMPVVAIKKGKGIRNVVHGALLAAAITGMVKIDHAFVEQVTPNPIKGGIASSFSFGRSAGLIEGVLSALGIPITFVQARKWQLAMKCVKGKDGTRSRAATLWPDCATLFARKKDDGRADAAMIARYGRRQLREDR